ncbi:MAG: hypothetical protein ABI613_03820 [Gemmatimonadota bacterium]
MIDHTSSRREFLTICSGLLLFALPLRVTKDHCASGTMPKRGPGDHPTPRPGIDASRVLENDKLTDHPESVSAFEQVRQIPEIADGIRCHCGCSSREGYYSLLSCYEGEGMAMMCIVCQGQGRLAFRLHKDGKSLDDIRKGIDARFG